MTQQPLTVHESIQSLGDTVLQVPRTVGPWTRSDKPEKIDAQNIFDYMDGAGELYLAYRFCELHVFRYTSPQEDEILLELYWMDSSDDAYGLLSADWGGDRVTLGAGKAVGLYGAGLLRVWSDNLYIRIMADRETSRSKEAILTLGRKLTETRKQSLPPLLARVVPTSAGPNLALRMDRFCFLRSHLVLNVHYFLSTGNLLSLGRDTDALIAEYRPTAGNPGRTARLLMIHYTSERQARRALDLFMSSYFPERSPDSTTALKKITTIKVEDGWTGHILRHKALLLAFGCSDPQTAEDLLAAALKQLPSKEEKS